PPARTCGQRQWGNDLLAAEPGAAVRRGRIHRATVGLDVLVHHHDDQVAKGEVPTPDLADKGTIGAVRAPAARAAEQERTTRSLRRHAVGDERRERLP